MYLDCTRICYINYSLQEGNRAKYRTLYEEPVKKWDKLKAEGVSERIICEFIGISRATYYRYKKVIINLRKNIYPASKAPKRRRLSESSVGRIIDLCKNLIQTSLSAPRQKHKRRNLRIMLKLVISFKAI